MTLRALTATASAIESSWTKRVNSLLTWCAPDRTKLLVAEPELEAGIDGYILDINLRDQVDEHGQRFIGTGAGLAQDLRSTSNVRSK